MRRPRYRPLARRTLLALALTWTVLFHAGRHAGAQEARSFQLEVFINGLSTNLIGSFVRLPQGRFAAHRSELAEIGIKPTSAGKATDVILLDDIPDLQYRYDEAKQAIFFTLSEGRRVTRSYDAGAR